MNRWLVPCAGACFFVTATASAQPNPNEDSTVAEEAADRAWTSSVSISTYLAQHSRDFVNPVISADRDWLHLEARYNYEAIKTGSLWLGYNFDFGEKLAVAGAPMLGFVFGDSTGLAPGYSLSLTFEKIELFTQGEYFVDAGTREGNFFYSWTELSFAPLDWLRAGLVLDRTKLFGSDFDIRRGPLIGFSHDNLDFTTYWLNPGGSDATFVFALTVNF